MSEPFKNPPRCSQRQACQTLLHFLLALNYYRRSPHGVIGRVFGLHVGAMLASLSLLGASWAHFSRLAAFVMPFARFFTTWGAPASILESQVGHMLAHFSLLAVFFDMVQALLQKKPAGISFLLFVFTMKRGGTCEAHGIEKKKNRRL